MALGNWQHCKNILIIRADNMGDLIMSTPALRALKETFNCRLTVLTSTMGKGIADYIEAIDDVIVFDAPWVKTISTEEASNILPLVDDLKARGFDGAIVFTVYSQSPMPAAMLALMAGIPNRLAYCRENPYGLLTTWIPDEEPYQLIRHQVERDLNLVKAIGASTTDTRLSLTCPASAHEKAKEKLTARGIDLTKPFVVFHAGVSEEKRKYPPTLWKEVIRLFEARSNYPILLTGSNSEKELVQSIQEGSKAFDFAGSLAMDELIALIDMATGVVSVNTGTIHIAAAMHTPVLVLYAETNPQHTPWQVKSSILPFSVPEELKSKNEVIRYVNDKLYRSFSPYPSPQTVVNEFMTLLQDVSL